MAIKPGDDYWLIWRGAPPESLAADGSFTLTLQEAKAFSTQVAAEAEAERLNRADAGHYVKVVKQLNAGMNLQA